MTLIPPTDTVFRPVPDGQQQALTEFTLHDSPDFLALVPYLLGYQPAEQLILVAVDGRRLCMTAAVPLAALADSARAETMAMSAVHRFPGARLLLACWSASRELAEEALGTAEAWVGPENVLDSAMVVGDWWHSRWGGGRGGPVAELGHAQAAAQAVLAGLTRAGSREEVVALLAGPSAERTGNLEALYRQVEYESLLLTVRQCERRAVATHGQGLQAPPDASMGWGQRELALLGVLAGDPAVQDALWLGMSQRTADEAVRLWLQVVAQTPLAWAHGPLLVLAFAAWLDGNGVVMVAAIERAYALGVRSAALALLDQLNREAVPPSVWEQLRARDVFGVPVQVPAQGAEFCPDQGL